MSEKNWIDDLCRSFKELCLKAKTDPRDYEFFLDCQESCSGRYWTSDLYVKGMSRIDHTNFIMKLSRYTSIHQEDHPFPSQNTIAGRCGKDNENYNKIKARITKAMACCVLLTTGTNALQELYSEYLLKWDSGFLNVNKPDPDYSFLSFLDLNSEEECFAGLLYLISIVFQANTRSPFREYTVEELVKRCRIIARQWKNSSNQNTPSDYYDLSDMRMKSDIFWGATSTKKMFSWKYHVSSLSAKAIKEAEKLIRFIVSEEDGTTYKEYKTPEFSLFSVNDKINDKIRAADLKKTVSPKMARFVLGGLTRTEILETVIPTIGKCSTSMTQEEVVDIVQTVLKDRADKSPKRVPLVKLLENLTTCAVLIESAMDQHSEEDHALQISVVDTIGQILAHASVYSNDKPVFPISEMLLDYVQKNPRDGKTFNDCLFMACTGDKIQVIPGTKTERYFTLRRFQENWVGEDAIKFLAEALNHHGKSDCPLKPLSRTSWKEIAENPEKYKEMPYEWVYGALRR